MKRNGRPSVLGTPSGTMILPVLRSSWLRLVYVLSMK